MQESSDRNNESVKGTRRGLTQAVKYQRVVGGGRADSGGLNFASWSSPNSPCECWTVTCVRPQYWPVIGMRAKTHRIYNPVETMYECFSYWCQCSSSAFSWTELDTLTQWEICNFFTNDRKKQTWGISRRGSNRGHRCWWRLSWSK